MVLPGVRGVRGVRVLGVMAVVMVTAVHLTLCAGHVPLPRGGLGAGGPVVRALAGAASPHGTADSARTPHGTGSRLSGGGDAEVEHLCATAAVEQRAGADLVPEPACPPVPPSCGPVRKAGVSWLVRAVVERGPTRCVIQRC